MFSVLLTVHTGGCVASEEIRKLNRLVMRLANEVDEKNKQLQGLEYRYNVISSSNVHAMEEKDELHAAYMEGLSYYEALHFFNEK